MKKIISLFIVLFLFVFSSVIVKASNTNNKLVVELPSNSVTEGQLYNNQTVLSVLAMELFLNDNGEGVYTNLNDKQIIRVNTEDDKISYELLSNVSESDCTFSITNEYREMLKNLFSIDPFSNYSSVVFKVKKMNYSNISENYVIDLTNKKSSFEMNYLEYMIFVDNINNLGSLYNPKGEYKYKSLNGKVLFTKIETLDENMSTTNVTYSTGEDLSEEDDIVIELTDEIKNTIGGDLSTCSNLVLKFSNSEYQDENTCVFDYSNVNDNNLTQYFNALDYAINNNRMKTREEHLSISDKETNKELMNLTMLNEGMFKMSLTNNISYSNNETIELSNDIKEQLNNAFGVQVSNITLKFANPKFLEGQNQKYDANKKGSLTFRLDIDYDKFLASGKVYVDNKLVDSNCYTVTSGSTIITFKDTYSSALASGKHTLKVTLNDGSVSTTFKAVKKYKNPKTYDGILNYVGLLIISISSIILITRKSYN